MTGQTGDEKKPLIIVTAPMRSGTSFVCQLLERLGANFGDPDDMLPADKWNPQGYFENKQVIRVNHEIVFSHFAFSNAWTDVSWGKSARADLMKLATIILAPVGFMRTRLLGPSDQDKQAVQTFLDRFDGHAVKDPRFCHTIHTWAAIQPEITLVYCERDNAKIVTSLHRMTKIPSILLWPVIRQFKSAFSRNSAGMDKTVIDIDRLIQDKEPVGELEKLYAIAGRNYVAEEALQMLAEVRRSPSQTIEVEAAPGGVRSADVIAHS